MAPVPSSARSGTLTHLVNFLMIPPRAVELLVLIGFAGFFVFGNFGGLGTQELLRDWLPLGPRWKRLNSVQVYLYSPYVCILSLRMHFVTTYVFRAYRIISFHATIFSCAEVTSKSGVNRHPFTFNARCGSLTRLMCCCRDGESPRDGMRVIPRNPLGVIARH